MLRRLATEKLRLTDKKVNSRPAAKGLMDQILHGHNLRELFNQQARLEGTGEVSVLSFHEVCGGGDMVGGGGGWGSSRSGMAVRGS